MLAGMPYSYHTFLYPFIWDNGSEKPNSKKLNYEKIVEIFQESACWQSEDFVENGRVIPTAVQWQDREERRQLYAQTQYFYRATRPAMFGIDDKIVESFHYKRITQQRHDGLSEIEHRKEVSGCALFIIRTNRSASYKGESKFCLIPRNYALILNAVRLRIYSTGVAILEFELENDTYRSFSDIKNINAFGRMAGMPILDTAQPPSASILSPESIELKFHDGAIKEDFRAEMNRIANSDDGTCINYCANFITDILSDNDGGFVFGTDFAEERDNQITIQAAVDERMFVSCLVRDSKLSANIEAHTWEGSDSDSQEFQKSLYEFIYADPAGNCSCNDRRMREMEMDRAIYRRWLDYGTMHSVSHHSLMCITGEIDSIVDSVIHPFLTEYLQIMTLCVAQRASINVLHNRATNIVRDIGRSDKKKRRNVDRKRGRMRTKDIIRMMDLQEDLVRFNNSLNFFTITSQYQGDELYNMLRQEMYIAPDYESLDNKLNNLYETANVSLEFGFNKWALLFAIASLGIDAVSMLAGDGSLPFWRTCLIVAAIVALAGARNFFRFSRKKR